MDPRLQRLISDYQARVAEAVVLLNAAGIERPSSAVEWVRMEFPELGGLAGGFRYFRHGFGCAVRGPDWGVDFDFGEHGEIDGFDAHRLYDFASKRLSHYAFSSADEIERSVKDAHRDGDLTFSGYILYYLSSDRAVSRPGDAR